MELPINKILCGDALKQLRKLPDNSVHCIVTSPPYWGLRDYGVKGQLGLEATPKQYVRKLVKIFEECWRVLRKDGTLWLNLGDSYAGGGRAGKNPEYKATHSMFGKKGWDSSMLSSPQKVPKGLKPKDLVGIPWMVAFALRNAGWYLRSDIIWYKRNPMPESVNDRPTKAHEYIFLLTKSDKYYYDAEAIKTEPKYPGITGMDETGFKDAKKYNGKHSDKLRGHGRRHTGFNEQWDKMTKKEQMSVKANKRSVWDVPTRPYADAHFATFPQELITDCIKAGTSEHGCCVMCGAPYTRITDKELIPGPKASFNSKPDKRDEVADVQDQGSNRMKDGHKPGWIYKTDTIGWQKNCPCNTDKVNPAIVFDIFFGAGTTGVVARKLGRNFIGIELNEKYIQIAEKRLQKELGLFI